MVEHRQSSDGDSALPLHARLPINRCNLPPQILGSLTFQQHPVPLQIDGVMALHGHFFEQLDEIQSAGLRAKVFQEFMRASFFLDHPEEAGLQRGKQRLHREHADYQCMLRGWMFDADGQEAAVLKSWVESRFGLLPRSHHGPLGDFSGPNYQLYLAARSTGLYNTNALEAQLDLLYTYCQYELARRFPARSHIRLYRGLNRIDDHERLAQNSPSSWIMLLNNLNSFSGDAERADEFGDLVITSQIPLSKILYMPGLFPRSLRGEQEYLVIGGVYLVERHNPFSVHATNSDKSL